VLYAAFGDVHGNLQALETVLADIAEVGADRVICVGDLVGYGANPGECVSRIRDINAVVVAGNHDWAAVGRLNTAYFNADARDSIEWTRAHLSSENLAYLASLPLVCTVDDITVVHSSPSFPEYFDYLQTLYDVQLAFEHMPTQLCMVGHSHVPLAFVDGDPISYWVPNEPSVLSSEKAIINVGSVGQPRDRDPRACYALYDSEANTVQLRRLEYDMTAASERMVAAGLPATNAARILVGR